MYLSMDGQTAPGILVVIATPDLQLLVNASTPVIDYDLSTAERKAADCSREHSIRLQTTSLQRSVRSGVGSR